MRLRKGGDLAHLQEAADGADVGLDDIGTGYRQQAQELEAAVEALAGRQRAAELSLHLAPSLDVLRPDRLLEEQGIVGRQRVAELDRLDRLREPCGGGG